MHDVMRTCLAVLFGLALTATGLWAAAAEEEPAAAMGKEMVLDPTTGKMVTAPEYGGTFTWGDVLDPPHCDPYLHGHGPRPIALVAEKLGIYNWGTDRDEWGFGTPGAPLRFATGALAESWEMVDPLTYVFNIRKGVRWHDKAPMNGREFTADDVVYNFHRYTGMGSGFTEPSAVTAPITSIPFESIMATDDATVVVKLTEPKADLPDVLLINWYSWILPPEVIEQHGDITDCDNMVGTGPYMLTEWVKGSSLTYVRNPDYWGFDEKYPENRLPYIEQLNRLIMTDRATQLAALRSGKLDYMGRDSSSIQSMNQADSLKRTNPEIALWPYSFRSETSVAFNLREQSIYNDIRVRKAMQMAIDLETINDTYFMGLANTKPQGIVGDGMKGYYVPFEEWQEAVKKVYTFDPEGAEALLDEAGYPRGADGIRFKTVLNPLITWDVGYQEITAEYWGKIGVDVEIQTREVPQLVGLVEAGTYEGMTFMDLGVDTEPSILMGRLEIGNVWGRTGHEDPVMDAKAKAALAATDRDEHQRLVREADLYMIGQHWYVWGPKVPQLDAVQPWVKGFNGEVFFGYALPPFERMWIDSALKTEMGF